MGCHCTKTKEVKETKLKKTSIILQQDQLITQSSENIKIDFEEIKIEKICVLSNSNRGKLHNPRVIGGKKEIFSQLYIRPYEKK